MGSVLGSIKEEESARFEVVGLDGDVEIRRYHAMVVAETEIDPADTSAAFKTLASYYGVIGSPANRGKLRNDRSSTGPPVSIDMTVPVLRSVNANGAPIMAFVLPPRRFPTLSRAPNPTNEKVALREVGEHYRAVIRYTGASTYQNDRDVARVIIDSVRKNSRVELANGTRFSRASFNSPFSLPFWRTNEVHVDVNLVDP